MRFLDYVLDNGYLPTPVIRLGIRRQLAQRVQIIAKTSEADALETKMKYLDLLRSRPIAIETAKANEQHYEVGTGVLKSHLGPRMKVSTHSNPDHRPSGLHPIVFLLLLQVRSRDPGPS